MKFKEFEAKKYNTRKKDRHLFNFDKHNWDVAIECGRYMSFNKIHTTSKLLRYGKSYIFIRFYDYKTGIKKLKSLDLQKLSDNQTWSGFGLKVFAEYYDGKLTF